MTEAGVLNILLKNEETKGYHFDYPKQQSETVKVVARNLTDIIYESYKRKSCASTSKRYQVLKFINTVCKIPDQHEYEDYMKCGVKQVKDYFPNIENEAVTILAKEIALDLRKYDNIQEKFSRHYSMKHAREKEKQKQIDFINEKKQEKLNKKYQLVAKRKYTFEPNENLINKILGIDHLGTSLDSNIIKKEIKSVEDRDTQIKFAYAMLNTGQIDILTRIFDRISKYKVLIKTERNFLQYIWSTQNDNILNLGEHIDIFYFLLEETLLKHAMKLLEAEDNQEVCKYFMNLENDCDIIKIRKICKNDYNCYLKLKTLLFELYCISYCNENVMKLSDVIII
ncbi:unnamed protein product [Psylliodes chrysocephalus]|uniref:Uncharacterized protein n=1 Tax=Psylliodes chrysocephalus TaxID=3402493 RepID=A0A9P0D8R5_9CUCU|nr:unnamed protein product [Psylliodes chrysocephala]